MDDDLPYQFYSSLYTRLSRRKVAQLFGDRGWSVRKCAWYDYEVISDAAELVIEATGPILLHGPVASLTEVVPQILDTLTEAGIEFSFEAYDENDKMVMSKPERRPT